MTPRDEARRAMALTLGFDVVSAAIAMALALHIRWTMVDGAPPDPVQTIMMASAVFGLSAILAFWIVGIHKQVWRHMGWIDAVRVIQAVGLAALFFLPVLFLWNRLVGFPRMSLLIAIPVWVMIIFAARIVAIYRSTSAPLQIFRTVKREAPLVILAGDTTSIADVIADLGRTPDGAAVRLLGIIAVDSRNHGRAIKGVPVLGDLEDVGNVLDVLNVRYGETPWVAVTGKARDRSVMTRILEETSPRGTKVMALEGEGRKAGLHRVRPADLLARPERNLDVTPVRNLVEGSRVFVTGAGGTIGSELVRQCLKHKPSLLAMYDACELNLYEIDRAANKVAGSPDKLFSFLGDVRDTVRLEEAMKTVRPGIVIHAAALKHVPLMEENVCEAILTNVGGTLNSVRIAAESGAEHFVLISTDKAVDPDNVMGATKRLAEIAVCNVAERFGIHAAMVRFGNVLGSSGSVVPLFKAQIETGGPVTVTDPEVTRYFMTVEEASSLVLQAAALNGDADGRNLFVLDMGEPVKISELAEAMIRMRGLVPERDIQIEYTGLRRGEKLHEKLTYQHEETFQTKVDGVMSVNVDQPVHLNFDAKLEELLELARLRRREEALQLLAELVPEYQPKLGLREQRRRA